MVRLQDRTLQEMTDEGVLIFMNVRASWKQSWLCSAIVVHRPMFAEC